MQEKEEKFGGKEMELIKGFPLFMQQTIALLKKNYILSWRSKWATFIQLFSSFFFIALLIAIQKTQEYRTGNPSFGDVVYDPKALINPPILACEKKLFINLPCYDFVWSGGGSKRIESLVTQLMSDNPGRPIPATKVKSFATKDELNNWLSENPMRVPGALHFVEISPMEIRFGLQTNSSSYVSIGRQIEDPDFKFRIPLQYAASRAIARSLVGDQNFSFDIGLKEFAHPKQKKSTEDRGSRLVNFGAMFFFATSMFGFVFQVHSLVLEKELKLRQTMSTMGLFDSAYWSSWFIWEGGLAFLQSLVIVVFGLLFRLELFLKNNIVVVFLLFFIFTLSMVGFAFMMSNFIHKSTSTTSLGFSVFIIGFIATIFGIFIYSNGTKVIYRILLSLFPPVPFSGGLMLLLSASERDGISWSERAQCSDDEDFCATINYFYAWLSSTFFLWSVLAIYFDNIVPNSAGVRKSIIYFLFPSYWTGRGDHKQEEDINSLGDSSTTLPNHFIPDDEDVHQGENSIKQAAREGGIGDDIAFQLRGLAKTYSKRVKIDCKLCCFCCLCCKCKMEKSFHAVRGLWMNFPKNQLFCLLGPNGAGKTTTISCLTGITPVTQGDAFIYGHSIRSAIGMSNIRRNMGVCGQFDALWDALSGEEHLALFASVKGVPPASNKLVGQMLLADVDLDKVANLRVGSYSGGMKRRISLAIALVGDPKLLILDEPTTGMDPITRRRIWNLIERAKPGRSIILTTHSMIEAEVLSDRIGIMVKGKLRCIGTSARLKERFGTGYVTTVKFPKVHSHVLTEGNDTNSEHRKAVTLFFRQGLNIAPTEEKSSSLTFILPIANEETLADFFEELESRTSDFGIRNLQLGLGTLEDVFLNIVKKAELEAGSDLSQNMKTITLTSGASLRIPLGARYVKIPRTESEQNPHGHMVEVFWKQDDTGNLCISKHSQEIPVPPTLQPIGSSSGNVLNRQDLATGIPLE